MYSLLPPEPHRTTPVDRHRRIIYWILGIALFFLVAHVLIAQKRGLLF